MKLLTVREAAERLGCSEALVYLLCSERRLPHVRLGTGRGTIRIQAVVRAGVAPGTLILPRHRRLNWRQMSGRRQFIDGRSIGKG